MPQVDELSSTAVEQALAPDAAAEVKVALSFVIPVMNEELNVRPLFEKLSAQLTKLGQTYEIIFVDDGSTDGTFAELKKLYDENRGIVRVIRFRRNFGKTPHLSQVSAAAGERLSLRWMVTCRMTHRRSLISWRSSTRDMIWYRAGSSRASTLSRRPFPRVCSINWSALRRVCDCTILTMASRPTGVTSSRMTISNFTANFTALSPSWHSGVGIALPKSR